MILDRLSVPCSTYWPGESVRATLNDLVVDLVSRMDAGEFDDDVWQHESLLTPGQQQQLHQQKRGIVSLHGSARAISSADYNKSASETRKCCGT